MDFLLIEVSVQRGDGSDVLREMIRTSPLMSAEADGVCGAGYGERSPDRVTKRIGYRRKGASRRAAAMGVDSRTRPASASSATTPTTNRR